MSLSSNTKDSLVKITTSSKDYVLETSVVLPVGIVKAFEFFKDPRNLSKITPLWLDFKMIVEDHRVFEGAEFDYHIKWFGIKIGWKSRIVGYRPPFEFTDIQIKGPYAKWEHWHSFKESQGKTVMYDRVTYRLPFSFIGKITHALVVKRQLINIFTYRAEQITRYLCDGDF